MNPTSWGDAENASLDTLWYYFNETTSTFSPEDPVSRVESGDIYDIQQHTEFYALGLSIAVNFFSTVGLILNTYLLVIIVITKQVSSASSVLLLHLSLTGIGVCTATLGAIPSNGVGCLVRVFLLALFHPLQLWTVCGLNADRCAAIAAPLHYTALVSPKKAAAFVAIGWISSALLLIPLLASASSIKTCITLTSCSTFCGEELFSLIYCLIHTAFTLFVPTILIFLCSLKILRIARHHRHRIAAAIYEVTVSAQVTVTHQRNPFRPPSPPRTRSTTSALIQPLGSLFLLYYPFYVTLIWSTVEAPPLILTVMAAAMLSAAPTVNCIVYGIKSKSLKKALQNYWRKRLTKSEITQEIQARTPSACGSRRPSLSAGSTSSKAVPMRRLSDAGLPRGLDRPTLRTASCNALSANKGDIERVRVRNSAIPILRIEPHIVLGRALGLDNSILRVKKSPRITVTRALSDESTPEKKPLCRQQSRSSGALLCREDCKRDSGEDQLLLSWLPVNEMHSSY